MNKGDLVRVGHRFWEIEANHPGAAGQESVFRLRAIGVAAPADGQGRPVEVNVPHDFLRLLWREARLTHYVIANEATFVATHSEPAA